MPRFTPQQILSKLEDSPVVPLFFHADASHAQKLLDACYTGGLRAFEFTNRGASAPATFAQLSKHVEANLPDLALGIGTIYRPEEAEQFLELGADFIIQPIITPAVGEVCQEHKVAWMPGALTPNEVYLAESLGATVVKIFPGDAVGPGYIKALRGPMPKVKLMVTGGVQPNEANLREWFAAGVNFVGIGSQLIKKADELGIEGFAQHIAELVQIVKVIRK
ncbi:MAG: bifunctional 4-hydroxy-2-oxoglutarate aldolase/2-dehydro-3-deoxy-phosphogluconate aldolase [Haliscomenobacter sp.]|uniref:bifunctional 4-hydroxy-2-oxoglutarate aldolase/2-dehydro-3-deoxy-phosphogluconate aldolase n=1 Tax=Haliscomenobacter sp. TaxID=2717303 RepID=UPI0029AB5792|nr:bifunctional 4-hydroxy-2-oxoglutarate aldolase/2-dehydro-3-deoxy-phosphogluconate aldolase [Haliscomenobacter sp.]MDX2070104.1 bifunctional 4-hydroxy-2-oxoglutarate aldolase/2-dehydro-3-deoxy-phosphogluconate aldolase [Haliscomenobacter sp.]